MKVLLKEDIDKLGYLGDIVDVKDGYARNYLLPQGLGIVPTEGNIKSLAKEKVERAQLRKFAFTKLEKIAAEVAGAQMALTAKANEFGHLFGSVSEKDIAENLRGQGFEIKDDFVKLPEHIKEIGTYEVTLRFGAELAVEVTVVVAAEGGEESEDAEGAEGVEGDDAAATKSETE